MARKFLAIFYSYTLLIFSEDFPLIFIGRQIDFVSQYSLSAIFTVHFANNFINIILQGNTYNDALPFYHLYPRQKSIQRKDASLNPIV